MLIHPPATLVANCQVYADGSLVRHELGQEGDQFILLSSTSADADQHVRRGLCPTSQGIVHALQQAPELLRVGVGITDITTASDVDLHTLLGLLVVDEPGAPEPNPEKWSDEARELAEEELDIDIDDWFGLHDQIHRIRTAEGYTLVARWLRIDDDRAFVVTGPEFATVGVFDEDSDWNRPGTTRDLLEWSFYRESGAPITWDGAATLGWCGPKMWSFSRRGDIDPDELVVPSPPEDVLAEELAQWVLDLDWELGYLLSAVGLPGLTEEDRAGLSKAEWAEGEHVTSHLPRELDEAVIAAMCQRHPALQQAVDGLRNAESERGQLIYAWVRQVAHGPYQSGSWDQVHAAMVGNIEPPADDQRAPTMQERWASNVERAAAVLREATGQPQPLPAVAIPEGMEDEVRAALGRHGSAQLREAIAVEQRDATLIDGARATLGVTPGERGLMRRVKALTEKDPEDQERHADLWSAFWVIQDWDSRGGEVDHQEYLATLQARLRQAEQSEQLARGEGWPQNWPAPLLPQWLEHGGTVESAQAWAAAGWPAVEVLTAPRLTDTWNPSLDERLTLQNPPPHATPREGR